MKIIPGFVFIDIETSVRAEEAYVGKGDIIQIAAISTDLEFNVHEKFEKKIIFDETTADSWILDKIHYDVNLWDKEACNDLEVAEMLINFCTKYAFLTDDANFRNRQFCICGGHNISCFDLPVLFNWYKKLNKIYGTDLYFPSRYQPCIDTLSMINLYEFRRQKWFKSHKLSNLCETFGIELINWHEALADIEATVKLAKFLLEKI